MCSGKAYLAFIYLQMYRYVKRFLSKRSLEIIIKTFKAYNTGCYKKFGLAIRFRNIWRIFNRKSRIIVFSFMAFFQLLFAILYYFFITLYLCCFFKIFP